MQLYHKDQEIYEEKHTSMQYRQDVARNLVDLKEVIQEENQGGQQQEHQSSGSPHHYYEKYKRVGLDLIQQKKGREWAI